MKMSSVVLWGVVGVLVALSLAVSCADSSTPVCDLADCQGQCIAAGHAGGECRDSACFCNDTPPPDADADIPDIIDIPPESPPDIVEVADESTTPDEAVIREDAVREDYVPREDYTTTEGGEGGGSDTGGEAKSGCDPLLCFMSCGGTCSAGGECVCDAP